MCNVFSKYQAVNFMGHKNQYSVLAEGSSICGLLPRGGSKEPYLVRFHVIKKKKNKNKNKERERDNIVFPDVNLTIVTLFEPGPLQQLRNMLAKSCVIA